jgi:hypothetical protein
MPRSAKRKKRRSVKASAVVERAHTKKVRKKPTNLSLDPGALERAEQFAKRAGQSVSQLVTRYLFSLPTDQEGSDVPRAELSPAVRRLYGVAAGGETDRASYRDHLLEKYGVR